MAEKIAKTGGSVLLKGRNYQLDFLKLVFTIFVILSHTGSFVNENTNAWFIPTSSVGGAGNIGNAGWIAVHFFFIVSGLLMVNSYKKRAKDETSAPKQSFNFIMHKFKSISIEYWVSLLIGFIIFILLNIESVDIIQKIVLSIPEIFGITECGVMSSEINGPAWYISAMLISMLPLYYMLCKNEDFFIYVFSPISALLIYGYMFNQGERYIPRNMLYGVVYSGLIRAVCGICFGVICYIIFIKISSWCKNSKQRTLLTIAEVLLYVLFFLAWYDEQTTSKTMYPAMLLLPIAIAISFSGKSYISELFKFKFLKCLNGISLALYFNHCAALRIVQKLFPNESYKKSLALMMGLTILISILYFILVSLIKKAINKKRIKNDTKI